MMHTVDVEHHLDTEALKALVAKLASDGWDHEMIADRLQLPVARIPLIVASVARRRRRAN